MCSIAHTHVGIFLIQNRCLKLSSRYIEAISLLKRLLSVFTCDSRRGYWTLRLSIDLEHIGRPNESLVVAEDALTEPWIRAGSVLALQRRILRLGKPPRRWKIPSFAMTLKRKLNEVTNKFTSYLSLTYGMMVNLLFHVKMANWASM